MTKKKSNRASRDLFTTRYRNPVRLLDIYLPRPLAPITTPIKTRQDLRLFEDRRTWHPERWGRPVMGLQRAATRIVVTPSKAKTLPARLSFIDPKKVIVCHRRKERREVLHALGKGGGGNRRPTRKPTSEITC